MFAYLQYLLPRQLLTRVVHAIARIRIRPVKDFLIRSFVRMFDIELDDVERRVPEDFATLNDFFVRELAADARPVATEPGAIVSPADGRISEAGSLEDNRLLQAKGLDYTLEELLATDLDDARRYAGGAFATVYLAPYNYHRVHAPLNGRLAALHYVPGDLFSVNNATATTIRGLFHRNERLIMHFDADHGPWALVMVGALNVGSITTPWTGEIRPRRSGVVELMETGSAERGITKGDLVGWFNMGSTVIVLLPRDAGSLGEDTVAGRVVRVGEALGKLSTAE